MLAGTVDPAWFESACHDRTKEQTRAVHKACEHLVHAYASLAHGVRIALSEYVRAHILQLPCFPHPWFLEDLQRVVRAKLCGCVHSLQMDRDAPMLNIIDRFVEPLKNPLRSLGSFLRIRYQRSKHVQDVIRSSVFLFLSGELSCHIDFQLTTNTKRHLIARWFTRREDFLDLFDVSSKKHTGSDWVLYASLRIVICEAYRCHIPRFYEETRYDTQNNMFFSTSFRYATEVLRHVQETHNKNPSSDSGMLLEKQSEERLRQHARDDVIVFRPFISSYLGKRTSFVPLLERHLEQQIASRMKKGAFTNRRKRSLTTPGSDDLLRTCMTYKSRGSIRDLWVRLLTKVPRTHTIPLQWMWALLSRVDVRQAFRRYVLTRDASYLSTFLDEDLYALSDFLLTRHNHLSITRLDLPTSLQEKTVQSLQRRFCETQPRKLIPVLQQNTTTLLVCVVCREVKNFIPAKRRRKRKGDASKLMDDCTDRGVGVHGVITVGTELRCWHKTQEKDQRVCSPLLKLPLYDPEEKCVCRWRVFENVYALCSCCGISFRSTSLVISADVECAVLCKACEKVGLQNPSANA